MFFLNSKKKISSSKFFSHTFFEKYLMIFDFFENISIFREKNNHNIFELENFWKIFEKVSEKFSTRKKTGIGLKIEIYGVFRYPVIPQKFQNFSPSKNYFFSSSKKIRTLFSLFSRKNPTFFRNLKNIGIFPI